MRWRAVTVALTLGVASCGGDGGPVRMEDAQACGRLVVLFVSADEHRAVVIVLSRERAQALGGGPTELELADLDASLLFGRSLGRTYCTDLPGDSHIDRKEPVIAGTLSITIEAGRADLALQDAATDTTEVEDATFSDVFMAGSPG